MTDHREVLGHLLGTDRLSKELAEKRSDDSNSTSNELRMVADLRNAISEEAVARDRLYEANVVREKASHDYCVAKGATVRLWEQYRAQVLGVDPPL